MKLSIAVAVIVLSRYSPPSAENSLIMNFRESMVIRSLIFSTSLVCAALIFNLNDPHNPCGDPTDCRITSLCGKITGSLFVWEPVSIALSSRMATHSPISCAG